jgi:TolB-like protein
MSEQSEQSEQNLRERQGARYILSGHLRTETGLRQRADGRDCRA